MKKTNSAGLILILFVVMVVSGCSGSGKTGLTIGLGCGTHDEKYTTSEKGCENMDQCKCIHKNFFGSCDNCECTKEAGDC